MKFIFPILFFNFCLSPLAHTKLISKIVGYAGGQYITSREVQINSLLEAALFTGKVESLSAVGEKNFFGEVNSVLLERVVSLEATQFAVTSIRSDAFVQAKKKIEKVLRSRAEWKVLRATPEEIEKQLRHKLMAKQFIRFKIDTSYVPVTDSEAEDFFRKNPQNFKGASFKDKKDEIKSFLSRQRVDQRLKEWFGVLQKKYAVRNFITPTSDE